MSATTRCQNSFEGRHICVDVISLFVWFSFSVLFWCSNAVFSCETMTTLTQFQFHALDLQTNLCEIVNNEDWIISCDQFCLCKALHTEFWLLAISFPSLWQEKARFHCRSLDCDNEQKKLQLDVLAELAALKQRHQPNTVTISMILPKIFKLVLELASVPRETACGLQIKLVFLWRNEAFGVRCCAKSSILPFSHLFSFCINIKWMHTLLLVIWHS